MSNDNIALFISFISLFASIIFGALNWLHTNKAFKATEYPVVGLEIMDIVVNHLDHRSYIKYKITNFSKELTVLNLVLIIKIAKPNNRNLLLLRIPVMSHTNSGACRTVRRGEMLVEYIVHQVCDMVRNPRSFLWESPSKERQ